jgi:hypothetical protein
MIRDFLFVFLAFFLCANVVSQNPIQIIDSLKTKLPQVTSVGDKAKIYADLTWYYSMVDTDSAFVYGKKSMAAAKKIGDSTLIAQALSDFAGENYSKVHF